VFEVQFDDEDAWEAFRGLPVRIRPGSTVVTKMRSRASSERMPCDSPTNANLLAL